MMLLHSNVELLIFVDKTTPDNAWVVKIDGGKNEMRFQSLQILTPVRTVELNEPVQFGRYALRTEGVVEVHPVDPLKGCIRSSGMPSRY